MRMIDPHIHMISRVTDDYARMKEAGIDTCVEPAFWLGQRRTQAGTFFDYFDHMADFEVQRAAQHGVKRFCALSMNPREANDEPLAKEVLAKMGDWLDRSSVVAVGEIGFDEITEAEERAVRRQMELASEHHLPVLFHTPHRHKLEGVRRIVKIVREMRFPVEKVCIDHNTEETVAESLASGCWCGHTVYPITKLSPERAADIFGEHGFDRMMVNSSADWGPSDPLSVAKTAAEMQRRKVPEAKIRQIVWDNPVGFYRHSGRFQVG